MNARIQKRGCLRELLFLVLTLLCCAWVARGNSSASAPSPLDWFTGQPASHAACLVVR